MALLDLNAQATSRLSLEPIKNPAGGYFYGGMVPARIDDVHILDVKHEKGEFKDMEVPVLVVDLVNYKLTDADPDRSLSYSFRPVGTKKKIAGTEDQYENRPISDIISDTQDLWKTMKHFLENLTGSPHYRDITKIPKEDVVKYFDLPDVAAPDVRIKAYRDFFTYILDFIKGDGNERKSQIVDAANKPLPIWVKLLPNYDSDPKRNKKYYTISRFIGTGVFEPMKIEKDLPVAPKIIKLKASESLELLATTSAASTANYSGAAAGGPSNMVDMDPEVARILRGGN